MCSGVSSEPDDELSEPVNPYEKSLRSIGPEDEVEVHQLLCVPEVYEYLADGVEQYIR